MDRLEYVSIGSDSGAANDGYVYRNPGISGSDTAI